MQTTTEQDICALLKGIAISCIRKKEIDCDHLKQHTGKGVDDIWYGLYPKSNIDT